MLSIELFQLVAASRQLVAVDNAHICVMCLEFLEVMVLQMDDLIAFFTDVTKQMHRSNHWWTYSSWFPKCTLQFPCEGHNQWVSGMMNRPLRSAKCSTCIMCGGGSIYICMSLLHSWDADLTELWLHYSFDWHCFHMQYGDVAFSEWSYKFLLCNCYISYLYSDMMWS